MSLRQDIQAVFERDPAAKSVWEVVLCYPGLHALWIYRMARWLWVRRFYLAGRWLSHLGRWLTGIEIHPGARISPGLFIDHGMGVVIGETTEIGEGVTLYQGVTLGGVSWKKEKRHPTLGKGVVVGSGAKVLGAITIGENSRIGANSVVVKDVPPDSVVVGVPGNVRSPNGSLTKPEHLRDLRHDDLPDAVMERLSSLVERVTSLEQEVTELRSAVIPVHLRGEADDRTTV
ncbi:MAG: serine O-acetyltransferase [Bacillota bacterium]|jgi:serine O-acetyltransferase